jgi:hypothetical protein
MRRAQSTMIDMIGMSFIPMYNVVGCFLLIASLTLIVWGEFWLIITVCLRLFIIATYKGFSIFMLAAFWGMFLVCVFSSTG